MVKKQWYQNVFNIMKENLLLLKDLLELWIKKLYK